MSGRCIIIQGPITKDQIIRHKKLWDGEKIIFSTWENTPYEWFEPSDEVILNKIPEDKGTTNLNLQKITTQMGCMRAKELGYDFVIKWRNDMFPTAKNVFLTLFDEFAFNIYTWVCANGYNYISDFFYGGSPTDIYELFEGPIYGINPEIVLSQTFFEKGFDKKKINFIKEKLTTQINDVIWESKHHWIGNCELSTYKPSGVGYCKDVVIHKIKQ